MPVYQRHVIGGDGGLPTWDEADFASGAASDDIPDPLDGLDLVLDEDDRSATISLRTSSDAVMNPLYGPEMVKAVDSAELWAATFYPLLHNLHTQLCGDRNLRHSGTPREVTNR